MLTPGLVLSDRYRLSRCIAVGGMSRSGRRTTPGFPVTFFIPRVKGSLTYRDRYDSCPLSRMIWGVLSLVPVGGG